MFTYYSLSNPEGNKMHIIISNLGCKYLNHAHSSEIRGLCLMKWPREMLQLPYLLILE